MFKCFHQLQHQKQQQSTHGPSDNVGNADKDADVEDNGERISAR